MVLIDTKVFMRLANGAHGAERIERPITEVTAEVCFINPVIASALWEKVESGAGRLRKRALRFMADILGTVQRIDMDCSSGQESGLIRAEQSKKGKPVATPDGLIAGRARHAGMIIVTDDTRHVGGITRLKLQNWRVSDLVSKIRPTGNSRQQEDQYPQFLPAGKLRRRGDRLNRLMPYSHLLRLAACRASPGRDRSCYAPTR